ncbi:hypothetical protein L9F63_015348, partial [Diploptera punctata]
VIKNLPLLMRHGRLWKLLAYQLSTATQIPHFIERISYTERNFDVPLHLTMSFVPQGALLALLATILHCAMTSPVWMPQFLSG